MRVAHALFTLQVLSQILSLLDLLISHVVIAARRMKGVLLSVIHTVETIVYVTHQNPPLLARFVASTAARFVASANPSSAVLRRSSSDSTSPTSSVKTSHVL